MSDAAERDNICDQFEADWNAGSQPSIVKSLEGSTSDSLEQLLRELIGIDIEFRMAANQDVSNYPYLQLQQELEQHSDPRLQQTASRLRAIYTETLDELAPALQQTQLEPAPSGDSDSPRTHNSAVRTSDWIGPYKILQPIGEGGMGSVYMAEQIEPVRRRVALKVIRTETPSNEIIARFEAERQALAMMDHHNIAKVLDAGITEDRRPYFAMELVKGIPITEYCDSNKLNPAERLELFVQTCRAIQHAHTKGIVHRDIKPSNVLVTQYDGKPTAKVIDFGLAKALQDSTQLTDRTLFTMYGQVMGTLAYMSPEQAEMNAQDVDARTDVYSLGVILYELMTGSTPITTAKIRSEAFDKILALIREEDVSRPSQRLSESGELVKGISEQRKTEPKRLGLILKGDLDWIAIKALEKDRIRRYDTPAALAGDVERYLKNEPIEARPPSLGYRLQKAWNRNRAAFLGAGLLVGLLIVGLIAVSLLLKRAITAEGDAIAKRDELNLEVKRSLAAEKEASDERDRAREAELAAQNANAVAVQEQAVSNAVRRFLQDDILKQASIYQQAYNGVDDIVSDLTVKQAVIDAASRLTVSQLETDFPNLPGVQAEILATLAETLSTLEEGALAVRCSTDRISILEQDAKSKNIPLEPKLLGARMEHLFFQVNAGKSADAAGQYALLLQNLEASLKLTADDFPGQTVDLDREIDVRTSAVLESFAKRLDPKTFKVNMWLTDPPGVGELVRLVLNVIPTLGQPARIHDMMVKRYPPTDLRVLYTKFTVATENHSGADIVASVAQAKDFPFLARASAEILGKSVSYDRGIILYRELIETSQSIVDSGLDVTVNPRDKVSGVRFMLGVALMSKARQLREATKTTEALAVYKEAEEEFQLVRIDFRKRLAADHPAMLMFDDFLLGSLTAQGRNAEAIPLQQHLIELSDRYLTATKTVDEVLFLAILYVRVANSEQNPDLCDLAIEQIDKARLIVQQKESEFSSEEKQKYVTRCRERKTAAQQLKAQLLKPTASPETGGQPN